MVKVEKNLCFFQPPWGFPIPVRGFPHIFIWGLNPAGFCEKNKYEKNIKKLYSLKKINIKLLFPWQVFSHFKLWGKSYRGKASGHFCLCLTGFK